MEAQQVFIILPAAEEIREASQHSIAELCGGLLIPADYYNVLGANQDHLAAIIDRLLDIEAEAARAHASCQQIEGEDKMLLEELNPLWGRHLLFANNIWTRMKDVIRIARQAIRKLEAVLAEAKHLVSVENLSEEVARSEIRDPSETLLKIMELTVESEGMIIELRRHVSNLEKDHNLPLLKGIAEGLRVQVDAAVKITKRLLKKTTLNEEDCEYGLLEIRNIPQPEGVSEAQELFGRETRTKLSSEPDRDEISEKEQLGRNRAKASRRKKTFDKGSRQLKRLASGNRVRIQPQGRNGKWKAGICQAKVGPRSYNVFRSDGSIIRRNRRHLILTKEARNTIISRRNGTGTAQKGAKPAPAKNVIAPAPQSTKPSLVRPARLSPKTPLVDKAAAQVIRRSTRERKPVSRYQS